ncbi:colicin I receptor [Bdellovibrio bacteriovorus W]|nr:colicin I receptor [Bdellovibrio bacteriovorus W]
MKKNLFFKKIPFLSLILTSQFSFAQVETSTSQLSSIIVSSASQREQSIAEAPASITVVTQEDIQRQPVHNITDVLKYSEGVMTSSSNDKGISLRGLDSSYTLILVNGKRVSSRSLSVRHNADADLSWISPDDIERIEIIRGPMATLYGAEAIGGVVNIITKKISASWKAHASSQLMRFEDSDEKAQNQYQVSVSGPIIAQKLQTKLNASFSQQDRPEVASTDSRQYAGHKDSKVRGELEYLINEKQKVQANVSKSTEKQTKQFNNSETFTDVDRTHYEVSHSYVGNNLSHEITFFQDGYEYDDNGKDAQLTHQTAQGNIKGQFNNHGLVAGFELQKYKLENSYQLTSGETDSQQNALFLEDNYSFLEKNTLTVGVRQTQHSDFGPHLSPRAYLVHQANENLTWKGGVGTGFKTPTLLQLSKDFHLPSCKGACTMIGNPYLKPEHSVSYEIGFTYTHENLFLNSSIFYSELSDMITTYFETINGQRYRLLKNVDKARTQGIEFGSRWVMNPNWHLGFNFTLSEGRNVTQDTPLLNLPTAVANLKLDWFMTDRLSSYSILSHIGHRQFEDSTGARSAPGYETLSLGMHYNLGNKKTRWRLGGGVENAMDVRLDDRYGFGELGRRYFVSLGVDTI